jgi:lambda family phage portal protein
MNLSRRIDQVLTAVAPGYAARRARARLDIVRTEAAARAYEAAANTRRTKGWRASGASAEVEIAGSLETLRNRHRQLVRDNPWAARAVRAIVNNTVGSGIAGYWTTGPTRTRAVEMNALWQEWSRSQTCDVGGRLNFDGLQGLMLRTVAEAGEVIVRKRVVNRGPGRVPLALQIIEPDHIDDTRDEQRTDGSRVLRGIEVDAADRVTAIYLLREHPGGNTFRLRGTNRDSERVPVADLCHIFRVDRPGQVRGVPWGAPVMLSLRDLDGYEDAMLLRQKLAACFVAFVQQDAPGGETANGPETLEPGAVEYVQNADGVTFATPPMPDGYGPYTASILRRVAVGYGVPYEVLTGDLSQVNYSSGRMGWLEFHRDIEAWRWQMLMPMGLERIAGWFAELAPLAGNPNVARDARVEWTPPARKMIDPTKEVGAYIEARRGGLISLQEIHRELGQDTEEVLAEIADENARLDRMQITVESDARKPRNGGVPAEPTDPPPAPPAD